MEWKTLWHYHLVNFGRAMGDLKNITQRLTLLCTVGGDKLRMKLDNRYNKGDMVIESITASANGASAKVTVGGAEGITLHPEQTALTDEVALTVAPGQQLEVVIHFAELNGVSAMCQTWSAGTWQTEFYPEGDRAQAKKSGELFPGPQSGPDGPNTAFGVDHIDVMTSADVLTVALFGDSITHMSFYYDPLLMRVLDGYAGRAALANEGIGGNRLCHDPAFMKMFNVQATFFGPAGYKRFEENLYTDMSPDVVILLEGINDCSHGFQFGEPENVPDAEQFAKRVAECVECAHRHGSRIYLGTIMPASAFDKEEWHDKYEALRLGYNDYIRTQTIADGVIDFDAAMRDPQNIHGTVEALMNVDGLHPNADGGKKMAEVVPLDVVIG